MALRLWPFVLLLSFALVGCGPSAGKKEATPKGGPTTAKSLREALGAGLVVPASEEWRANRLAVITPPTGTGPLVAALEDPFAKAPAFAKPENAGSLPGMISGLQGMAGEMERYRKVQPPAPETVATSFQSALNAYLLLARLEIANKEPAKATARLIQAHKWVIEAIETAPGAVAANEMTVSYLMLLEVITLDGPKLPPAEMKAIQAELASKDLRKIMAGRMQEDFSVDVLGRLETLSRDPRLLFSAATVLRREEDPEHYEELFKTALAGRGAPFDALETATITGDWVSRAVAATQASSPWPKIEAIFAEREALVVKDWSVNLFTVPLAEINAVAMATASKASERPLNSIFAYELVGSYPTLLEFATQCVFRRDAAVVTLAVAQLGRTPAGLADLTPFLPAPLIDPLSGGSYVLDAQNRRLRTELKTVGHRHLLLKSLVFDGFPY